MEPEHTSSRTFWIALAVLIVLAVVAFFVIWLTKPAPSASTTETQATTTLPVSASTTADEPNGPSQSLTTSSGSSVPANDFLHNGTTLPDPQNPGTYILQGTLGPCDSASCTRAGTADNYSIEYDASSTAFTIELAQEPLSQARLDAEQFLGQVLGISPQAMCGLRYYIGTTIYVNTFYAGKNLGFSFCPGATQLP